MSAPDRGEIWLVDLGLAAKVRPCLVLSIPTLDNERAIATAVAHTTSPRGTRFEVAIQVSYLRHGVFDAQNLVTVPHAHYVRRLGKVNEAQMKQVEAAVKLWIGSST
jgi:mRNA interferase MazF